MKVTLYGVALGSMLSASTTTRGADVDSSWESTFDIISACVESAAKCRDPVSETFVAGWHTKASCLAAGFEWSSVFPDAGAMLAAVEATHARYEQEGVAGLFLAELPAGMTMNEAAARAPAGVSVGDVLVCRNGPNFVYLDGMPAAVAAASSVFPSPFAVPPQLKVSPHLATYERANPPRGSARLMRRIRLSPGSQGRARQVLQNWLAKHEGRRRLMANPDETGDVQLHLNFVHHEERLGRRALEASDEEFAKAQEIIASTGGDGTALDWLAAESEATWVEPVVHMIADNMDAVYVTQGGLSLSGNDFAAKDDLAPFWKAGVHGEGEIVGVGDSGLDTNHCFFSDTANAMAARQPGQRYDYAQHRKVLQYVSYVDGGEGEVGGHGTHVAGSVAGKYPGGQAGITSDVGDPNSMKGMAYEAKLAFFDIGEAGQPYIYPPADIGTDMVGQSYEIGSRIHTNSWGGNLNAYTSDSRSVDTFTWKNQDAVILFANGNSGEGPQGNVGTPATSKNAVSVGASMNSNRAFAFVQNACPSSASTDCANNMAPFSSNGPTSDNRIKPDISAPGMYIGSSESGTSCDMTFKAGTSMATPVTAGNTALVRQFIREGRYIDGTVKASAGFKPMGALIKALLINSAEMMTGGYSSMTTPDLDASGGPTGQQGHGRTNLASALPATGNTADRSVFLDGNFEKMPTITQTGGSAQYKLSIGSQATDLRVTLVWYDPPATLQGDQKLINDLDLTLTDASGKVYYPNGLTGADTVNTAEKIVIPAGSLAPGDYTITVTGSSVVQSPQPYAIAVAGPLKLASDGTPGGEITDESGNKRPLYDESVVGGDSSTTTIAIIAGSVALVAAAAFVVQRRKSQRAQSPQRGPPMAMGSSPAPVGPMTGMMNSMGGAMRGFSARFTGGFNNNGGGGGGGGGGGFNGGGFNGGGFNGGGFNGGPSQSIVPGGGGLPAGWATASDPASGSIYYYNRQTGQTSWDMPKM